MIQSVTLDNPGWSPAASACPSFPQVLLLLFPNSLVGLPWSHPASSPHSPSSVHTFTPLTLSGKVSLKAEKCNFEFEVKGVDAHLGRFSLDSCLRSSPQPARDKDQGENLSEQEQNSL